MKKAAKRLQLNRETVRSLDSTHLHQAAGGTLTVTLICPRTAACPGGGTLPTTGLDTGRLGPFTTMPSRCQNVGCHMTDPQ